MYYSREMSPFMEAKEIYTAMREFERKKIINYLREKGLKVSQSGGMGYPCYQNGKRLQRNYDLSNWKWVSVIGENKKYFISLQAFDQDKNSKNYHVLMDRIGFCSYPKTDKDPDLYGMMQVTSLELPLDETDLDRLYNIILNNG